MLTGETGAGKSLVVDSLALLAGARAAGDLIREGAEGASVSGIFDCDGRTADPCSRERASRPRSDELVVRREISREGRNRVFVDDQPVTLRLLQSSRRTCCASTASATSSASPIRELQRQWLDRWAAPRAASSLARVRRAPRRATRVAAERLERLQGDERLRAERIDLLRFQPGEIDAARTRSPARRTSCAQRDVLRHREAIARGLGGAFAALYEDDDAVAERLAQARHALAEVAAVGARRRAALPELAELEARVQELARELRGRLATPEPTANPAGSTRSRSGWRCSSGCSASTARPAPSCSRPSAGSQAELGELDDSEEDRAALEAAAGAGARRLPRGGDGAQRGCARAGRRELVARLERELADLALPGRDSASASTPRAAPGARCDRRRRGGRVRAARLRPCRLSVRAQPRRADAAAARIASGGELARVSLALQLAARGEEVSRRTDPGLRRSRRRHRRRRGLGARQEAPAPRQARPDPRRHPPAQVASCGHVTTG